MSHIIKCEDNILMLLDDVRWIKNNGISTELVKIILKQMLSISNIEHFIDYGVYDDKYKKYSGGGVLYTRNIYKMIHIYMIGLKKLIETHYKILKKYVDIDYSNELSAYFLLGIIAHEVEHACQDLIGDKKILAPNICIAEAYKELNDIFINENKKEILKVYYKNCNHLLLERNAQIEGFDLVKQCAKYSNQKIIYNLYDKWSKTWLICGYHCDNKGSIYETYNCLGFKDKCAKYNFEENINEKERIRYGLPILNETREKLLLK